MKSMNRKPLTRGVLATLGALTVALGACDDKPATPAPPTMPPTGTVAPAPMPGDRTANGAPKGTTTSTTQPDNTERNKDHDVAPTAQDQGETKADRDITAEIRKAVLAEDNLSTNADNCKIITNNGVVTLRGPVASQAEKDLIERKAKAIAGVTRVVNELEVKP